MANNPFDQFDSANPFDQFDAAPAEGVPAGRVAPEWAQEYPRVYEAAKTTMGAVGPALEMAGLLGGGVVGSGLGPAGTVGGAGLGYAAGREVTQMGRRALGMEEPRTAEQAVTEPVQNVAAGAAMEMGGQAAGVVLGKALELGLKVPSAVADWLNGLSVAEKRAAAIAREAVGRAPGAAQALAAAPPGATASEALAGTVNPLTREAEVNAPTAQALLKQAEQQRPEFFTDAARAQRAQALNALATQAGGGTQTNALATQGAVKQALNAQTSPMRETALGAANIAGRLAPGLERDASRFAQAAASKVEDVRRFTAAGERAAERARTTVPVPGMPRVPGRYTYMGKLAGDAEKVAEQAAKGSLDFGMAARFKQYALDSLAAHNLQPLRSEGLVAQLESKLKDPSIAGNRELASGLQNVINDVRQWTNAQGVIDAQALDAIRKNSANAAAQQLLGAGTNKARKQLAGKIISSTSPLITDAIEAAGGAGYRDYLNAWSMGIKDVERSKMAARLLEMFRGSPKKFAATVEGDAPKEVAKIFGPGKTDIGKELGAGPYKHLQEMADVVRRAESIKQQATAGQTALMNLIDTHARLFRFPHFVSAKMATANMVLAEMERKLGKKTMDVLAEHATSAKSFQELLQTVPAYQRSKIVQMFSNPKGWELATKGATVNALSTQQSQNGLAP